MIDTSKKFLVAGAGKSGIGSVNLLLKTGADVSLYDGKEDLEKEALYEKLYEKKEIPLILGNITKEEIKTYVLQKGFKEKVEKKESMEVCFIENDYRDFLLQQIPNLNEVVGKGFFVDKKGKKLGLHKGFPFYTIGQRKGLEIALGHPAYVIKINPYKNTIRLGDKEDLLTTEMLVESPVINIPIDQISDREIQIRIRYRSPAIRGTLFFTDDNYIVVKFKEPVSAVTPGQSAVFYSGNQVIGGGIISDQHNLKKHTQNKTQV